MELRHAQDKGIVAAALGLEFIWRGGDGNSTEEFLSR